MHHNVCKVLSVLLLIATACYGQSLGDAARKIRASKNPNAPVAKKVITTDDLSTTPDADFVPPPNQTPEMWSCQITAQKMWVRYFQAEVDKLNAQQANARNAEPPMTKQAEDDLNQRLEKVQRGFVQEKAKLEAMQQAARDARHARCGVRPTLPAPGQHFERGSHSLYAFARAPLSARPPSPFESNRGLRLSNKYGPSPGVFHGGMAQPGAVEL